MKGLRWWLAALCFGVATHVWAGFSITGTRVIYREAEGESTVRLQRVTGSDPVLLQVWLDDGSADARPGGQDLPFLLTPAVARVEANGAQVIRIVRIGDQVPADREMLLYFNALEVPSVVDESAMGNANYLQIATQARMKFFYRPKGLPMTSEAAADVLRFALQSGAQGELRVHIHNPSPYHITLPRLAVLDTQADADATPLVQLQETGVSPMVAPFADLSVPLTQFAPTVRAAQLVARPASALQVRYGVINDQGGIVPKTRALDDATP